MQTQAAINCFLEETGGWVASQLEACTRCGICAEACHFYQATGKPEYTPVWKMELVKRAYEQRFTIGGKVKTFLNIQKAITDKDILDFSKYVYEACTVCNKCSMVCPMGIDIGPIIHHVRSGMAAAGAVPADLQSAVIKQINEGSPLGATDDVFEERIEWIVDEWEEDMPMDQAGADSLVIFSSIEIMKFPTNLAAIAKILNTAGEKWTLSSKAREVVNFGYYEGSETNTKLILNRVIEGAKELGVKRIVVTECGHAYDALRFFAHNIIDIPADIEITHIVGLIGEYLRQGKIKLEQGALDTDGTITFHDACKIQRRGGHIHEPRDVLNILAPKSFKEMSPNREESICCGGGGGVIAIKSADPQRYEAFNLKIGQINQVGAGTVVMSCSNCRLQFLDCINHFNLDLKVAGLSQLVADSLVE